ncbi:MAG: hypothetical protein V1843_01990 [bacterium]
MSSAIITDNIGKTNLLSQFLPSPGIKITNGVVAIDGQDAYIKPGTTQGIIDLSQQGYLVKNHIT